MVTFNECGHKKMYSYTLSTQVLEEFIIIASAIVK